MFIIIKFFKILARFIFMQAEALAQTSFEKERKKKGNVT